MARISAEVRIDPDRVYATGISNGGMLAYRLACDTRIFAAIGPDSATQLGRCRSLAPVSVIHIHGTADRDIPYHGGTGQGFAHIDGNHSFAERQLAVDRPLRRAVGPAGRPAAAP